MPKNKKGHPTLEELLERPWCYYCERDFEDLKILIDHQRHKHFKCERCGRRLNTAGGLSVHLNHVHKEQLGPIENALPNRASHEIEIFGMEGIPEEVAEAERRAATGNPATGASGGPPAKKPKFESPAEMKKRLAEHRAKKAEEAAAAEAAQAVQAATPPMEAGYQNYPQPYTPAYGASPQPYGQPFQAPSPGYPNQVPSAGYNQAPNAGYSNPAPPYNQSFQQLPYSYPTPAFQPPVVSLHLPSGPVPAGPPPGLPQRPSFNAPSVNVEQMQQLHQGQASPYDAAGTPAAEPAPLAATENGANRGEKKKKDKDKGDVRMVYADNEISPEEKMALMPRYAFDPSNRKQETVLEDAEAKGNMVVAAPSTKG